MYKSNDMVFGDLIFSRQAHLLDICCSRFQDAHYSSYVCVYNIVGPLSVKKHFPLYCNAAYNSPLLLPMISTVLCLVPPTFLFLQGHLVLKVNIYISFFSFLKI